MTSKERASQLRVGIFMAIGLLAIGLMVVYFGRFGESIHGFYRIRVEYPNASGIYKGASVLLAGAKIGSVENNPVILPDMDGVYVDLRIFEEVKIPSAAEFTIGSSGLLGDRFVQIVLGKDAKSAPPIAPGAVIQGKSEAGMGDVFDQAAIAPDGRSNRGGQYQQSCRKAEHRSLQGNDDCESEHDSLEPQRSQHGRLGSLQED